MFRAHITELPGGSTLKLEGRMVGHWANEAKALLSKHDQVPKGLIVDLSDVSYIDTLGEQVLLWFASIGALFKSRSLYPALVCERLQLPLQESS